MHHKISLSGGRTSAYMLRLLLDEHGDDLRENWSVLFCNTGKEFDATLDFVHEIETRWNVPVVWLEYVRIPASEVDPSVYPHQKSQQTIRDQQEQGKTTHWFRIVNYETAYRNDPNKQDSPFDTLLKWGAVLPNTRARYCTVQMKVRTMERYLFSRGIYEWTDYIGIRSDEAERMLQIQGNAPKRSIPAFPLCDSKLTVEDVTRFWSASDFDLQLEPWQGNCDGCFLKATAKRKRLARQFSENYEWWENWEREYASKADGNGRTFRYNQSYASVRLDATAPTLFELDDEVHCGCADGGFTMSDVETED